MLLKILTVAASAFVFLVLFVAFVVTKTGW